VRISWNPSPYWSLQTSWARQNSPEQLEPDEDQEKFSASAIYARAIGDKGSLAVTAAIARKQAIEPGSARDHALDAAFLEASWKPDARWTVFGRAEIVETDELLAPPEKTHGPEFTVGKASLGAIRDFALTKGAKIGIGGLLARSNNAARARPELWRRPHEWDDIRPPQDRLDQHIRRARDQPRLPRRF